jgi:hypothetical protein
MLTELADFCELSRDGVEKAAAEIDEDRRNRWQSLPGRRSGALDGKLSLQGTLQLFDATEYGQFMRAKVFQ